MLNPNRFFVKQNASPSVRNKTAINTNSLPMKPSSAYHLQKAMNLACELMNTIENNKYQ
jgi:hypothetical protein